MSSSFCLKYYDISHILLQPIAFTTDNMGSTLLKLYTHIQRYYLP